MSNRIGQIVSATNGQKMTLIAYRCSTDIDVQFEDGTIVCNKSYAHFRKGSIKNPNKKCYIQRTHKKSHINGLSRIGETLIAKNGQKMTIIAYRGYNHIDVQFEDGTIVTDRMYNNFKKREIKNPNLNKK